MQPAACLDILAVLVESEDMPSTSRNGMQTSIAAMGDILGGLDRLLQTPIPVAYTRHTSRFTAIWLALFPMLMHPTLGAQVVPYTALLGYIYFGTVPMLILVSLRLSWKLTDAGDFVPCMNL